MNNIATLDRLEEEYGQVICYPKHDPKELRKRIKEMKKLRVKALFFTGEKIVANTPVLGKGCVGIVVLALTDTGKVALKIRRTDADRTGMKREAEMLRIANSVDVGPKLLSHTENLLMMEFIDGKPFPKWIETIEDKANTRSRVRRVLKKILEQSWRLDKIGLDHGELSQASKHIIVDADDEVYLLDFETASTERKVSNVTSICHYLFMNRKTFNLLGKWLREIKREKLLGVLKEYKQNLSRENFDEVLKTCEI